MFHGLYLGKAELKLRVTSKSSPTITAHAHRKSNLLRESAFSG